MNYVWTILLSYNNPQLLELTTLASIKTTFLLAFVALICLIFRPLTAATRHLLWTFGLCCALLLPFLSLITIWEVPVLPAGLSVQSGAGTNESAGNNYIFETIERQRLQKLPVSSTVSKGLKKDSGYQAIESAPEKSIPLQTVSQLPEPMENAKPILPEYAGLALLIWFTGILLLLGRLLAAFIASNLLARRAAEFKDAELNALFSSLLAELSLNNSVRLLRSKRISMPIVCGILKPAVLLPESADEWSEERQRMVLLHELTHVSRRDCLTQMLAQIACAFYWFNPLIWFAARRLRVEREHACDDYVLSIGTKPSDYAHHLLEIARSMRDCSVFELSQSTSVAMARRSQLESRLCAILSKETKRRAFSRAATTALLALICLLFLTLGVIRPAVIKARNPQIDSIARNVEKADEENSLLDSIREIASEPENNKAIRNAETREVAGKQENSLAAKDSDEQISDDKQIVQDTENGTKLDIQDNSEQTAIETAPQITENIPSRGPSNVASQSDDSAAWQINIKYQKENQNQNQDKSPDYIDEMASVGYTNLTIEQLIRLKNGGVSADFVRGLRALGFSNLSVEELARMGIHQVTPSYIQAIRAAGYNDLSSKDLTAFRIHGVTTTFISNVRAAGLSNLSPRELVSLRIYGITPDFIRKAKSRLGELNIKQLISLKNAGVIEDEKGKDKNRDKDEDQG